MSGEIKKHFELKEEDAFPGRSIFTQIANYSSLAKAEGVAGPFKVSDEIEFRAIDLHEVKRDGKTTSLARAIYDQLEAPIFGQQSPDMPYSVENFEELLGREDAVVLLAYDKGSGDKARLVGYAIGYPYHHGDILDSDITGKDGVIGPMPSEGDLMFDTFATERQGQQVGSNLFELFLSESMSRDVKGFKNLFTFAVDPDSVPETAHKHAHPYTRYMLSHNPRLGLISETHIPDYRGASAYYMQLEIKKAFGNGS